MRWQNQTERWPCFFTKNRDRRWKRNLQIKRYFKRWYANFNNNNDYEPTGIMWTLDDKELLSSWYYHSGKKIIQVVYWNNLLCAQHHGRQQISGSHLIPTAPRRWQPHFPVRSQRHQELFPRPFSCLDTKKCAHLWCTRNSFAVTAKHWLLLKCMVTMATFDTYSLRGGRFSQRRFVG